jgi:hypothetical protein
VVLVLGVAVVVPAVALVPDQLEDPESVEGLLLAVQEVTLVPVQVIVIEVPLTMELSDTDRVTVGLGFVGVVPPPPPPPPPPEEVLDTLTVTEAWLSPPVPRQVRVYLPVSLGNMVWLPTVDLEPDQLSVALQLLALVVLQVSITELPLVMDFSDAVRVICGALGLVFVEELVVLPPPTVGVVAPGRVLDTSRSLARVFVPTTPYPVEEGVPLLTTL